MGSYYVPITEILVNAGCKVDVGPINEGWERRSRSSGGFDAPPLGVQWHHTASDASVDSDLNYMINVSADRPVGNILLDRNGVFHPVAGGAANTSGKGGPMRFSRGTCALDKGNTTLFSFEIANDGVGQEWPEIQLMAAFQGSNAINAHFGNRPDDIATHALGEGDGYTSRKIDPATAGAVQGLWRPRSVSSSGTWRQQDIRDECLRRSTPVPPLPGPNKEIDMLALDFGNPPGGSLPADSWWTRLTYTGDTLCHVRSPFDQVQARGGVTVESVNEEELNAMLDTVTTVGPSPFVAGGQAPNATLDRKWQDARGRG